MKKIYKVKRYTEFPKRKGKDLLMREFENLKQAQEYSIKLNSKYSTRYYIEEVEIYD